MAEGGWLKLYRELIEKPIWKCTSPEQKAILITLLCMANHEEKEWVWQGKKYKCKPGQFVTSLKSIAEKSGTSVQNVRTALINFQKIYDFLTSESTNRNRLITIVNWELYQSQDKKSTKRLTSVQQAANKQLTTNKNDKNDKEIKNVFISAQHLSMTEDEYNKLTTSYGKENVDLKIDYARNYKKLTNYKSLYLTLNNWLKSDKAKEEKQIKPNKPEWTVNVWEREDFKNERK